MNGLFIIVRVKRAVTAGFYLFSVLLCMKAEGKDWYPPVPEPIVSTIAGNGNLGVHNGSALNASFIEPDGLAVGPDGTVYVADGGAQEIRRIHNGVVELVAGHSTLGIDPQQRQGGYADGPVQAALFNRPVSIAVGKDGTLYIADLMNHCIRTIRNGIVSTFAGSNAPGAGDGVGSVAHFAFPKSIALDDDGNLYVADYGNGIRKISPNGAVVTTVVNAKTYGVAARGAGKNLTLAYTAVDGIHFRGPIIQDIYPPERLREPDHEGYTVGNAYSITIVGYDSVVISDLMHSAVRYVRFQGFPMSRALAGGVHDASGLVGGYQDGPSEIARVYAPFAVARATDGAILVADAGNRRIREIRGLDPRSEIANLSDLSGLAAPRSDYRIVVLGTSFAFHDVLWPESIPGQIEAGLLRDGTNLGLREKLNVSCVRINSGNISTEKSFVSNYLNDGQADLVVLIENEIAHSYELGMRPELRSENKWRVVEPQELRDIEGDLAKVGTKMLMVYVPDGASLSQLEDAQYHLEVGGFLGAGYDVYGYRDVDKNIENVYESSGVRALSLLESMVRAEAIPDRVPLFNTRDEHPSPEGQTWIGRAILRDLEQWKPWLEKRS